MKITLKDGTEIYYKDWGTGQPIVFHHGWPLSSDDWDAQMMFFVQKGYRVIAHDRRGHGRSTQTATGHDMETYVSDAAELYDFLGIKDAIHIGHSTGGGEVIRYVSKYGQGKVTKAVLISAVTPLMLQTENNPEGVPSAIFDEIRQGTAFNRPQYFQDFTIPFYGYNREGAKVSQGIRDNWWRQGMMGSVLAHHDGIKAFSETDFTEDLKSVDIPVLVLHGEDDQIVPFHISGAKAVKLLQNGNLIINESVTNSIKHAFSKKDDNVIEIILKTLDGGLILTIKDNGKGFSDDVVNTKTSFGILLMSGLADELNGKLERENDNGTIIRVHFRSLTFSTGSADRQSLEIKAINHPVNAGNNCE